MRLVVEADGGARGNPGPAAYGAVLRDAGTGRVLAELADHLGVATNNVAEYAGLVAGLEAAAALDPGAQVEARLDSKLVVEQMSGRWKIKNEGLRPLAARARAALPAGRVRYTWVPRAANARADALVNASLDAVAAGRPGRIERWTAGAEPAAPAPARAGAAGPPARTAAPPPAAEPLPLDGAPPPAPGPARTPRTTDDRRLHPHGGGATGEPGDVTAVSGRTDGQRPRNQVIGWVDLGPPTTTVLARHGATAHSLQRRFSGSGGEDPPLAGEGRAQAAALAAELAERGPLDVVVTSPLRRTRQTASVVAGRLGLPVEVEPGFAECGFGEWDGRTFAEVRGRWPAELEAWLASPDVAPPGGESFTAARRRVDLARQALLARHAGSRVVVVAHVTPIKLVVGIALDVGLHTLYRMELLPCSLTTVAWYRDGNAALLGFAESAHLRGVGSPPGT